MQVDSRITVGTGVGYGAGMVGERLFRDAPALLLLLFMTNYLAIPSAYAGMAVFLPKLLLVVIDPWVGYRSDTYASARGRRRPFLLVGAFLSALGFVLMFNVPTILSTPLRSLYMTLLIAAAFTVYSIYSVPYLALASELTSSAHERTRLLSYRMAFLAVGLNLSATAGVLIDRLGGGVSGYRRMALLYGAICLLTMLVPAFTLRDVGPAVATRQRGDWLRAMRTVLADVAYRRLLFANFLQKASEGVGYSSFAYFFLFWLHEPLSAISACVAASTVAQIIVQPLWLKLSRRCSRATFCAIGIGGYLVCNAAWLAAPPGIFWPVPVLGFLNGAFGAGIMLGMVAMMSDIAVQSRDQAGRRDEGVVSGIWLAIEKIGFAAGALLVGTTLSLFGFVSSTAGAAAPQSHTTLLGIAFAYVGLGTFLYLCTICVVLMVGKRQRLQRDSTALAGSPEPV